MSLARSTDTIPDSANRMNERICLLAVDLATRTADIDIDDAGGGIEIQIPDMLQKHGARHHLAGIADQI
jgi:hypothetical protein